MTIKNVAMISCGIGLIALGSASPKTLGSRSIAAAGMFIIFLAIASTLIELVQ